ncbi:putative ABC transporter substrate-binding protein [Actinoplanes missouriensis 431]|uniref:Putative ABC transporter substrate-binding protein n=1 Tax=Actinoplanes missouriensis (strain ATCC 14538 / DSM 43046 / CBS 188.64 / JCM 3121 / NBRC 102363 / NCIMB 12654 / NRRL B-3342 / UNCC 431) TaxID=512565 RepID=I0GY50_ACTM4|nr:sugar ABC transporter substrate-binding protein [Actinoplanes missouriensis]BAL85687.1 putative ABC transporter substrate-binding protein [Actinoplanes missouriensis 431]
MRQQSKLLAAAGCAVLILAGLSACNRGTGEPVVGLITKTDTNPFFVTMKKGAQQAADEQGVDLQTFAGKVDGDNEAQVQAIENLISFGAKGFLITPNDSKAIVPSIDRAKQADMLVIALDTPVDPPDAVDATFATDNFEAGRLIGEWAKAKFSTGGTQARIAMLDLNPNQVSVDVQRDQGFLEGFGVDIGDPARIGDENDPRIAGHDVTDGNEEGGRTAMENLLQKDPTINLVYTINEPAAAGAYEALKAAGREREVTIVSVDGGCPGVDNVAKGVIGATSMQFPIKMAQLGVEAIAQYAKDGTRPQNTAGKDFVDTGVQLITDDPQAGVEAKDSAWGRQNCWG